MQGAKGAMLGVTYGNTSRSLICYYIAICFMCFVYKRCLEGPAGTKNVPPE